MMFTRSKKNPNDGTKVHAGGPMDARPWVRKARVRKKEKERNRERERERERVRERV